MKSIQDTIEALRVLSEPMSSDEVERMAEIKLQARMIGEIFGVFGAPKQKYQEMKASKKAKEKPTVTKDMTFEEKRKFFQAEFPNKVSAKRRARARELLNSIAQNIHLYLPEETPLTSKSEKSVSNTDQKTASSGSSTEVPPSIRFVTSDSENAITAHLITSRSWPTTTDSVDSGADLTAPRVGRKASMSSVANTNTSKKSLFTLKTNKSNRPYEVNSRFNGVYRFGNYDNFSNFSKSTYDAAYANDTQSSSEATESNPSVYEMVGTPYHYDPEQVTPVITCVE